MHYKVKYDTPEPKDGDTIAVWFSCGAASATAAWRTLRRYEKRCNVRIVYNSVIEEDEDNLRFLYDVSKWLEYPIELANNPNYPSCSAVDVWDDVKYMSGIHGAPCTVQLKKRARQHWENNNKCDWHVLGFTLEEHDRHMRFIQTERDNVIPVLIDDGFTKMDCFEFIMGMGLELPRIYKQGYPNANCIGCVKATSPTYWNHVRKQHPEVFQQRAEQSERLGVKLVRVKGERIMLKDLDPKAKGRPMKNLRFECGIFCEELEEN